MLGNARDYNVLHAEFPAHLIALIPDVKDLRASATSVRYALNPRPGTRPRLARSPNDVIACPVKALRASSP